MEYAACIVPVAPLYTAAQPTAEMCSQLLFGETVTLLETDTVFSKVRVLFDGYEGWCLNNQLVMVDAAQANRRTHLLNGDVWREIAFQGQPMQMPFGAPLDLFDHGKAQIGPYQVVYEGRFWNSTMAHENKETIRWVAEKYLNAPYLWGGRSPLGIDCSGFVQQVYRFMGIDLPRDAYQQAEKGESIGFLQEAHCGDLAFFDDAEGRIVHVGLLLNDHEVMHAYGRVRIDAIDHQGIVNSETGQRTHRLRIIKRLHKVLETEYDV
jgi:hypothetical protein